VTCRLLFRVAGVVACAVLSQSAAPAQKGGPEPAPAPLVAAVEGLTREWFRGQTGDLAPDELPSKAELEADIRDMRDRVLGRIADVLRTSDALKGGKPDDSANAAAMARLVVEYKGLESATPIFTRLALSKVGTPAYLAGWRLCAIRVVAETYLPQVRETSAL
jgi:hypothetical protein